MYLIDIFLILESRAAFRGVITGYNCPGRQFFGDAKILWLEIYSLVNY
jgi:hypothetical protein